MTGEVFKLHVLPAGIADALVLDYGTADMLSRVVFDGGVGKTAGPLASFLGPTPKIEMLMITHVDNDHIAGALKMPEDGLSQPTIDDLWFNGFRHLPTSSLASMGPVEGERLTSLIANRDIPWNVNPSLGGNAVMTGDDSPTAGRHLARLGHLPERSIAQDHPGQWRALAYRRRLHR